MFWLRTNVKPQMKVTEMSSKVAHVAERFFGTAVGAVVVLT